MFGVYLFTLGIGGVLLAASFFHDADTPDGFEVSGWQQLLSFRNITYFLFVFGAVGTALSWLTDSVPGFMTFLFAAGGGIVMAALSGATFGYLRRTDTSEVASDSTLLGMSAVVTLPVSEMQIGKIELLLQGKRVELLARPFRPEETHTGEIEGGSEVLIVDMVAGTALVSRISSE